MDLLHNDQRVDRLPHLWIMICIVLLIIPLIFNRAFLSTTPPQYDPNDSTKNQAILFRLGNSMPLLTADKTGKVISKTTKAETLVFLGVTKANEKVPVGILVQRENGERGVISAMSLGLPFLRASDDVTEVYIKKNGKKKDTYVFVGTDGKKKEAGFEYARPILPEGFRSLRLLDDGDYFMTKEKFERQYIGQTLAANDKRHRMAWHIAKTKDGWEAYYPNLELVDRSDGKIYNPVILYDQDGVATGYRYSAGYAEDMNADFIQHMPGLGALIDFEPFARMIEKSLYETNLAFYTQYGEPGEKNGFDKDPLRWIAVIVFILGGLLWFLFTPAITMFLADCSLYIRKTYLHLNDTYVMLVFALVAAIATYIWSALMVVWGCQWFAVIFIALASLRGWRIACRHLNKPIPRERCTQCRRMEVNVFDRSELNHTYYEWRNESDFVGSRVTGKWQTWTQVTEKWSDGSTKSYKKDVRDHESGEHDYVDYRSYYQIDVYDDIYRCKGCGHEESIQRKEETRLESVEVGRHTETYST